MKVYIRNQQRLIKVNRRKITSLLRKALHLLGLSRVELSIFLVNDRRMRILNREYRGVDRTTDVLSFPQYRDEDLKCKSAEVSSKPPSFKTLELQASYYGLLLGDIVINLHKAKRQAVENGLTLNEELKRLLIHGLLHLIGYDHEKNPYAEKKMHKIATELLRDL